MHNATFVWKIPNSPWESLARATWQFFDLIVNTYIHIYVYIANEWSTVSSQGCVGDQKVFLISPFFTSTAGQVPHRLEGGGGVSINYPLAQFQTPARFPAATHERLESTVPFFFFSFPRPKGTWPDRFSDVWLWYFSNPGTCVLVHGDWICLLNGQILLWLEKKYLGWTYHSIRRQQHENNNNSQTKNCHWTHSADEN